MFLHVHSRVCHCARQSTNLKLKLFLCVCVCVGGGGVQAHAYVCVCVLACLKDHSKVLELKIVSFSRLSLHKLYILLET